MNFKINSSLMVSNKIKEYYNSKYPINLFYLKLLNIIQSNENGTAGKIKINSVLSETIECGLGDIRVDLPVGFGNINSKYKLAILGLEPRNSHSKFNIEREKNFVYATPFGIEQWSEKNKYYKSFNAVLNNKNCYVYFSDVVKEYEVKQNKSDSDKNARKLFWKKASESQNIEFLKNEMKLVNATHIIALGSQAYKFLHEIFGDVVIKVPHPNARQNKITKENAWDIINRQIDLIFNNENIPN